MTKFFWPGLILSVAGAILSGMLLTLHARGAGSGWIAQVCGEEGGCDEVINSRWGVFPPAPHDRPKTTLDDDATTPGEEEASAPGGQETATGQPAVGQKEQGIPVAAFGLFYFSVLSVWFAAIGRPNWGRRWLHKVVIGVCVLGCLGSIWFIIVMAVFVNKWCPFCLASHVSNFLLLGSVYFFRPRAPKLTSAEGKGRAAPPMTEYPATRPAVLAVCLAFAVCALEWQGYLLLRADSASSEAAAALEAMLKDEERVRVIFLGQEQHELGTDEKKDPLIKLIENEKKPRMTLTYFSDFECPRCAGFDKFLFKEIKPLFDGHLRIVFKHYYSKWHKNAFPAATAAEAAHVQGKFWEAKQYLVERHARLDRINYRAMAVELGLNPQKFVQDMNSQAVRQRVQQDWATLRKVGIRRTPAVFLNSRPVSSVLREYLPFWKERAGAVRR